MKSLKKNFVYNITYQILILIIPFITTPYVSRVLGVKGVGTYSYTYSIVYYFMICAMIGFNNYGNRSIAKVRDDTQKLSKTFKEIHKLQIYTSFIMIFLYFIYCLFICKEYLIIAYLQSLHVISCMFDINWFFFGIEEFRLTVTRNTFIRILALILIFAFVKEANDVWKYTLILSSTTLLSQLLLWPFVKKKIEKVKERLEIKKHIIPCLKLFLPVIAVAIYKVMDKTMIGLLSTVDEVGLYENAEKVVNIPNAIITALGTVMLPRMTNMYANGKDEESLELIKKSIKLIMFLAFPMMFGLIAISKDFSVIFFGINFIKSGIVIIYLSITIIFLSFGNVIRTQYLIPKERDKEYIISAFLGALVNLIFNLIFIPKYASIGACIGTIAAEFIVVFYQVFKIRNELPIMDYLKSIIEFFIKSTIMFILVLLIGILISNQVLKIFVQIVIGFAIYISLNIKYVKGTIDIKKFLKKIK